MKMILVSLPVLVTILVPAAWALPPQLEVTIGCTVTCGQHVTERATRVAESRGLKLRFVTLPPQGTEVYRVDAIISPGGEDLEVRHYLGQVRPEWRAHVFEQDARLGQHSEASRARDLHELGIRELYFSDERFRAVPFLGICYGMQALAVSRGLPLVVDLHDEFGIANRTRVFDRIKFAPDSIVARVFNTRELEALESHHQAVDRREYERLRPGAVRVTGYSNDGLVPEALEFAARPLALGVQFHPEGSSLDVSDRIFGWLVERARSHALAHRSRENARPR